MNAILKGRYRFEIHKQDGSVELPFNGNWVDNTVVNSGVDMMFTAGTAGSSEYGFLVPITYCRLSNNDARPVVASDPSSWLLQFQQRQSNSYVASTVGGSATVNSVSYGSDSNWIWATFQRTFVFAPGGVDYNWNGVGVSNSGGNLDYLFSRVPLSPVVTVLGTEEFRVIYQLQVKIPINSAATVLSSDTFNGDGSVRVIGTNAEIFGSINANGSSSGAGLNSVAHILRGNGTPTGLLLSNAAFPSTGSSIIPSYAGSSQADATASAVTAPTYATGNLHTDWTASWYANKPAALQNNVRSILLGTTSAGIQWLMSANQTKSPAKRLDATFRIAWASA